MRGDSLGLNSSLGLSFDFPFSRHQLYNIEIFWAKIQMIGLLTANQNNYRDLVVVIRSGEVVEQNTVKIGIGMKLA